MIARPMGWTSVVIAAACGLQLMLGIGGPAESNRPPETVAESAISTTAAVAATADGEYGPALDGSRVEGEFKCIDCHLSEFEAWVESPHYRKGFMILRTAQASVQEYAEDWAFRWIK